MLAEQTRQLPADPAVLQPVGERPHDRARPVLVEAVDDVRVPIEIERRCGVEVIGRNHELDELES